MALERWEEGTQPPRYWAHVTTPGDGDRTAEGPSAIQAIWAASPLHGDSDPFPGEVPSPALERDVKTLADGMTTVLERLTALETRAGCPYAPEEIAMLREELTRLQDRLDESRQVSATWGERYRAAAAENDTLRKELAESRQVSATWGERYRAAAAENDTLRKELAESRHAAATWGERYRAAAAGRDQLAGRGQFLKERLDKRSAEFDALVTQHDAVIAERDALRHEIVAAERAMQAEGTERDRYRDVLMAISEGRTGIGAVPLAREALETPAPVIDSHSWNCAKCGVPCIGAEPVSHRCHDCNGD